MVKPERIDIQPFVFILIAEIGDKFKWLLSVNGVGSCGASCSKSEAVSYISSSERLTEKQKNILMKKKDKPEQLELF